MLTYPYRPWLIGGHKTTCDQTVDIKSNFPSNYFNGNVKCGKCGNNLDLWELTLSSLKDKRHQIFRTNGIGFIGGDGIVIFFDMRPSQIKNINLVDCGVPEEARIIFTSLNSDNHTGIPLLIHDMILIPNKIGHEMAFYSKPLPGPFKEGSSNEYKVSAVIIYIPKNKHQIPYEYLAMAFEHFLSDEFERMLVPSATAMEIALGSFINDSLTRLGFSERLDKNAFKDRMQIILPTITKLTGFPLLEDRIMKPAIELYKFRNKIAHKGELQEQMSNNKAAQLMASAMFTVGYLTYFNDVIKNAIPNSATKA